MENTTRYAKLVPIQSRGRFKNAIKPQGILPLKNLSGINPAASSPQTAFLRVRINQDHGPRVNQVRVPRPHSNGIRPPPWTANHLCRRLQSKRLPQHRTARTPSVPGHLTSGLFCRRLKRARFPNRGHCLALRVNGGHGGLDGGISLYTQERTAEVVSLPAKKNVFIRS